MNDSNKPIADITFAQAVERINHLKPIVIAAREANWLRCPPGLTGLAQDLEMYDNGIFSAEKTIKSMRACLGITVTPESFELGQLEAALYQGRFPGKASEPEAGGCDGL